MLLGLLYSSQLCIQERKLAISRLPPKPKTRLDMSLIHRVLGRWRIYAMCTIWYVSSYHARVTKISIGNVFSDNIYFLVQLIPPQIVGGELESIGSNSLMALWMKASVEPKYTVQNINYYPAGGTAVAIVALLGTVRSFLYHWFVVNRRPRRYGPITQTRDIRSTSSSRRVCCCRR